MNIWIKLEPNWQIWPLAEWGKSRAFWWVDVSLPFMTLKIRYTS